MTVCLVSSSSSSARYLSKHFKPRLLWKNDLYDGTLCCLLNDKFVAGLICLVSAHLLWSHSLHCVRFVCQWLLQFSKNNISQGSVV